MNRFLPLFALALGASASHAEGSYVGAGALLRRYDLSQPGAASDASGGSLSGRLVAGYDFDRRWGLELGYVGLGKPAADTGAAGRVSTRGHALFVAVKSSLPLDEKFTLFSKIGVDRHRWEVVGEGSASSLTQRTTDTALYLGLGMGYRISNNLAATFELERFGPAKHPGGPLAGASLGLQFKF